MNDAAKPVQGRALFAHSLPPFVAALPIILAYYEVKPATRSPLVEAWGSDGFPYPWITASPVDSRLALAACVSSSIRGRYLWRWG